MEISEITDKMTLPSENEESEVDIFNDDRFREYQRRTDDSHLLSNQLCEKAVNNRKIIRERVANNPIVDPPKFPKETMSEGRYVRENFIILAESIRSSPPNLMQTEVKESIWRRTALASHGFRPDHEKAQELFEEVEAVYIETIKHADISHVLRPVELVKKPKKKSKTKPFLKRERHNDDNDFSSPWHAEFIQARTFIYKSLNLLHPPMVRTLEMYHRDLKDIYLIDFPSLNANSPMDLVRFPNFVGLQIEQSADKLMEGFYRQVADFVETYIVKIHDDAKPKFLISFDTLMKNLLMDMMRRTVMQLVAIFETDDWTTLPTFTIDFACDENDIIFDPDEEGMKKLLHGVVEKCAYSLKDLNHIAAYLRGSSESSNLCLAKDYIQEAFDRLDKATEKYFSSANSFLRTLKFRYNYLNNGTEEAKVLKYISNPKHDFEDFSRYILHFRNLQKELQLLPFSHKLPLLNIHCSRFKKGMIQHVDTHINTLISKIHKNHQIECKTIIKEFELIRRKALTPPETTEELNNATKFIDKIKTSTLGQLQQRIRDAQRIMVFLLEQKIISKEDVELNAHLISWLTKIIDIFDRNDELFRNVKNAYETMLLETREKFGNDLEKIFRRVEEFAQNSEMEMMRQYNEDAINLSKRIDEAQETVNWVNQEEEQFNMQKTEYPLLNTIRVMLEPYLRLFNTILRWQRDEKKWYDGAFLELNSERVENEVDDYYHEIYKVNNIFKNQVKKRKLELEAKLMELQKQKTLSSHEREEREQFIDEYGTGVFEFSARITKDIKSFKENIPVIQILCNPGIRDRHWAVMSEIAGRDLKPDTGTSLRKVLRMDLDKHMKEFEVVSGSATKEHSLECALKKMKSEWEDMKFNITTYRDTDLYILSSVDDIQQMLDDHIVKTQTMKGSPFIKAFDKEIKEWEQQLLLVQQIIDSMLNMQQQWLYLEPIFSSEDINNQMPAEGKLFRIVDASFKDIMSILVENDDVLNTAHVPGLFERLEEGNENLATINKGLNSHLEKKRLYFPRFFFLSNDEMLEILSETKDPMRVQPHLKKLFEGVGTLKFDDDEKILAFNSPEGEMVKSCEIIDTKKAKGAVEKWLIDVERVMIASLKAIFIQVHESHMHLPLEEWVSTWPGQSILCISQIYWTLEVVESMMDPANSLEKYYRKLSEQLNDIVNLVRGKVPKQVRITLSALIVIEVHNRDVVSDMHVKKVSSANDFNWLAQLRYYWIDQIVSVRITNATVKYCYEYLGNTGRLVITPLTDRCYRTLIGAFHLNLNGAPEGPAGTGKTETTKDLAKALAVQCVVFNCSDGLDYIAMGKFFKGLASCGAWACFDEFNRIDLEVLSVVAQQILSIIRAVRAKVTKFVFEGTEISLNPNCYVCITMNPGYAGRSELPDNLKVLFRPVAMMVPDYALIAEISLYSYGFLEARSLAVKIVTVYKLCSEQLSSQFHYDYGMRAVKSVLSACGNLKLKQPLMDENLLILRSIIDVNLPKFLSQDVPLFDGIISDLFPGVELEPADYETFTQYIQQSCTDRKWQMNKFFKEKVIQTYEMMVVRHGFMLVGEPFSGKTCVLDILALALSLANENKTADFQEDNVNYIGINPKSLTMGQLYGEFDAVSHEWRDGVLANKFRSYASNPSADRKWIVFDGPVDAVWIENMNTVLDDNKKLCLMSGEIIQMSAPMSMIFEVMDLSQASPATVSRCGMIYLEASALGYEVLLQSWVQNEMPEWMEPSKQLFVDLCDWLIPAGVRFLTMIHEWISVNPSHKVASMLRWLNCVVRMAEEAVGTFQPSHVPIYCAALFLFSFAQSFGMCGGIDNQMKFDTFFREKVASEVGRPVEKVDPMFPEGKLVQDFYYACKGRGAWHHWTDLIKGQEVPFENIQTMIVPTMDTGRCEFLVELAIKNQLPLLFVGPTGTGKSTYVKGYLMNKLNSERKEDEQELIAYFLNFSAQTTANQVQDIIMSKMDKRRKGVYGPSMMRKSFFFVDDLNMPQPEVYGAQPPIELIRQFIDHGYWYDLKDTTDLYVKDLHFLAAMGIPGGGRNFVTSRLLRHFNVINCDAFNDETLTRIFQTMMTKFLRHYDFSSEYHQVGQHIIQATLNIYREAINNLLPTPSKSHYIFNLRDFSRVILGICLIRKTEVDHRRVFIRLWVHEVLRVFYDRLTDQVDKSWLTSEINTNLRKVFNENLDSLFESLTKGESLQEEHYDSLMFGDYLKQDVEPDERVYEEVRSLEKLSEIAELCLIEYNNMHKAKMDLVIFQYVLQHLSRICRILRNPGGNALLVGVGGSGRQSLTKLATFMAGHKLMQLEISQNYGLNEWREDIKKILMEAGAKNTVTVFLLSDMQIKEEIFLEDIDSLLNIGEVPNIFNAEERGEILEGVASAAQEGQKNRELTPLELFAYFVKRCKKNLHIFLAFSPIGSNFRSRIRRFPSMINCCTIDWFQAWPEDALQKVAERSVEKLNMKEQEKIEVVKICKTFHLDAQKLTKRFLDEQGRYAYVTPTSYLELIGLFSKLLMSKQNELMLGKTRYVNGLDKLAFAAEQISEMRKIAQDLQPQLEKSAEETKVTLLNVQVESKAAEEVKEVVLKEEAIANEQAAESQALKEACESELAYAMPAMEEASRALKALRPNEVVIVKSMTAPPEPVKDVMAAVCILLGTPPLMIPDPDRPGVKRADYWNPAKKLMGQLGAQGFLAKLTEMQATDISPAAIAKVRKEYISKPSFVHEKITAASTAAAEICKWVKAMDLAETVNREVAPKKAKLEEAETKYQTTMEQLKEKQKQLSDVQEKLENFRVRLELQETEKDNLERQVTDCKKKLVRAEQLIGGLGGEKDRWITQADRLQFQYENLLGDILVSAGIIAYLGIYTPGFREKCIARWLIMCQEKKLPCIPQHFSLNSVLGDAVQIQSWNIAFLPKDSFSIDNAIIAFKARKWPLMIDPQSQANRWIKRYERENQLHIVKFTDSDFNRHLENSITFGHPLLLENIGETVEPSLEPILLKQTFIQGGTQMIKLGEDVLVYSPDFRLYMTTKLRNPHYLPEISVKVTLINFMITPDGLEDQLLGIVVAKEDPHLEQQRQENIIVTANNKRQLKTTEDEILSILSSPEGNILEDETSINVLKEAKTISDDINRKQTIADETAKKIDTARQEYRPIAKYSSTLFFCLTDLPNIDPMYQYSLNWFVGLYENSISNCRRGRVMTRHLRNLQEHFTASIYTNVCRSLFEKHKLIFSFIMCSNILMAENEIDKDEFRFLLTGGVGVTSTEPNPCESWLSNRSWREICRLEELSRFKNFKKSFKNTLNDWRDIYENVEPHLTRFPGEWDTLTYFQKMIIMRCIRLDKVINMIQEYITKKLGAKFIQPPNFNLAQSYSDSTAQIPLLFVLSPGADPMSQLLKFAKDSNVEGDRFHAISLGQGQGPIAAKMIKMGLREGYWICLQNCHLAVSWMSALEKICEDISTNSDINSNFRLWLTSYPSPKFPVTVLQNSVKMTNESPTGIRLNMQQSYSNDPISDGDFFESSDESKINVWCRLLYGLCFFHALILERRKFGPLGFNIPYGFNESDLQISVRQLKMFIDEYEDVPYDAAKYMTGECNYGGRVTDDNDRRCLLTILNDFISMHVAKTENFPLSPSKNYLVPTVVTYSEFMEYIQELPAEDNPEVFGMHDNVDISKDMAATTSLFDNVILAMTSAISASDKKSPTEEEDEADSSKNKLEEIASDILTKVPREFDIEQATSKYPVTYGESMNTVLVQEMARFNRLIAIIYSSLINVGKASKGLIVMNAELEELAQTLVIGKIPNMWAQRSYPSLKPLGSYVLDLVARLNFFQKWFENEPPVTYWISGFYFTQAFLTGVRQNYARSEKIPIDRLTFQFQTLKSFTMSDKPKYGAYVNGLFLDGARWDVDHNILAEQKPKILNEAVPVIWLKPTEIDSRDKVIIGNSYDCPLYKTSERRGTLSTTGHSTNFVLMVSLKTKLPSSHWVKRGTALLCQLDS
ncbi:hypothetical protein SNEBB_002654 [Seison nebaliae]|nr:hypothetical protein SNEBB_002654 [Seison nebaliae]